MEEKELGFARSKNALAVCQEFCKDAKPTKKKHQTPHLLFTKRLFYSLICASASCTISSVYSAANLAIYFRLRME